MSTATTNGTDVVPADETAVTTYDAQRGVIRIPTPVGGVVLEFAPGQKVLSEEQLVLLHPLGIKASYDPRHVAAFLMQCQQRGFDPWAREAYLILYPGDKYVYHIGIDGFRKRGESTGEYQGRVTPVFCGPDGVWKEVWPHRDQVPYAAKVGIRRKGFPEPVYAVALYDEFAPMQDEWEGSGGNRHRTGRRVPTQRWRAAADGGAVCTQLAKCAEAQVWRAAFPDRFAGWYEPAEMERAAAEAPVADSPAAVRRREAHEAAKVRTVDGSVVDESAPVEGEVVQDPAPAQPQATDVRELLLAELHEQATILGRGIGAMSARWTASHGGRHILDADTVELGQFVIRWRVYVEKALRQQGRAVEADRYAQAGDSPATVRDLFGRDPLAPPAPGGAGAVDADATVAGAGGRR